MRLGSGRERSRCIMQFSLAAGSDRAVGRDRAWLPGGVGWGVGSVGGSGGQEAAGPEGEARLPVNSQFLSEAPPTTCTQPGAAGGGGQTPASLPAQASAADAVVH